jgi:hypothetical protein
VAAAARRRRRFDRIRHRGGDDGKRVETAAAQSEITDPRQLIGGEWLASGGGETPWITVGRPHPSPF